MLVEAKITVVVEAASKESAKEALTALFGDSIHLDYLGIGIRLPEEFEDCRLGVEIVSGYAPRR